MRSLSETDFLSPMTIRINSFENVTSPIDTHSPFIDLPGEA